MIASNTELIVADSSFYICFLEDIQRPDVLNNILDKFDFVAGATVFNEVNRCKHFNNIASNEHLTVLPDYHFGEILKPFFSKYEIEKGEAETITLASILYGLNKLHSFIIDELAARGFVKENLPHLQPVMVGTVGFLSQCCCKFKILHKDETLILLDCIGKSTFRVSAKVLNDARTAVGN